MPTSIVGCVRVRRESIMASSSALTLTSCSISVSWGTVAFTKSSSHGATNTPAISAAPGPMVRWSGPVE